MAFQSQSIDSAHITLDQSACIQSQLNIGETITHNICTGQTAVVPWGSFDWMGFAVLCGLGAFGVLLFIVLGAIMISTLRSGW